MCAYLETANAIEAAISSECRSLAIASVLECSRRVLYGIVDIYECYMLATCVAAAGVETSDWTIASTNAKWCRQLLFCVFDWC